VKSYSQKVRFKDLL